MEQMGINTGGKERCHKSGKTSVYNDIVCEPDNTFFFRTHSKHASSCTQLMYFAAASALKFQLELTTPSLQLRLYYIEFQLTNTSVLCLMDAAS